MGERHPNAQQESAAIPLIMTLIADTTEKPHNPLHEPRAARILKADVRCGAVNGGVITLEASWR